MDPSSPPPPPNQAPDERQHERPPDHSPPDLPSSLRVISLNCWGLKYLSQHRRARLAEIGQRLAAASPRPDIVGLQECWTQEDFGAIRALTQHILPHGKYFWSGAFGGGLAILSRFPLEESAMDRFPLNGRPAAFFRGDWYVGKGVASARVRIGGGGGGGAAARDVLEVFCTHLHAPYEREPRDSYLCHRTAQAWEVARRMRHAAERGHLVLGLGDFNMVPGSLAWEIVATRGRVRDVWREVFPGAARGSAEVLGGAVPSARECLDVHGATCDSRLNTWRWSKQMRKALAAGRECSVDADEPDARAKRLDYIFFADNAAHRGGHAWAPTAVQVGMTERHPTLRCSLSDHFSVEATLTRSVTPSSDPPQAALGSAHLPPSTYRHIQSLTSSYLLRERRQRTQQLSYFWAALLLSIACLVAIWWAPRNFVAFLLALLSTLALSSGVIVGLMGFLFVKTEIRALKEFAWEVEAEARRAEGEGARDRGSGDGDGEGKGEGGG